MRGKVDRSEDNRRQEERNTDTLRNIWEGRYHKTNANECKEDDAKTTKITQIVTQRSGTRQRDEDERKGI